MTLQSAQRAAYEATEKLAQQREKLIIKAYRDSYNKISTQLRNLYLKMQAEGIPKTEYFNYMTKFKRLEALEKQLFKDVQALTRHINKIQLATNAQTFTDMYYRKMYLINWTQEADRVFVVMNDKVLQTVTTSNIEFWKSIPAQWGQGKDFIIQSGKTLKHYLATGNAKALTEITDIVSSSFIRGESFTRTAREIKKRLGVATNNAVQIAITEGNRTANAGGLANTNIARANGIEIERKWLPSFINNPDSRHQSFDGQIEDESGNFTINGAKGRYPGALSAVGENVRCKCTVIDVIDGEDPKLRRGINPATGEVEIISFNDYDKYMDGKNMKFTEKGWVQK